MQFYSIYKNKMFYVSTLFSLLLMPVSKQIYSFYSSIHSAFDNIARNVSSFLPSVLSLTLVFLVLPLSAGNKSRSACIQLAHQESKRDVYGDNNKLLHDSHRDKYSGIARYNIEQVTVQEY